MANFLFRIVQNYCECSYFRRFKRVAIALIAPLDPPLIELNCISSLLSKSLLVRNTFSTLLVRQLLQY